MKNYISLHVTSEQHSTPCIAYANNREQWNPKITYLCGKNPQNTIHLQLIYTFHTICDMNYAIY